MLTGEVGGRGWARSLGNKGEDKMRCPYCPYCPLYYSAFPVKNFRIIIFQNTQKYLTLFTHLVVREPCNDFEK
jgi:hypothetical protein